MRTRRGLRPLLSRRAALIFVPFLAFAAFSAWGLSSAVGSSPDDDFHLSSIWCGLGDRDGLCDTTGDPDTREVPRDLVIDAVCYAFDPLRSADCQGEDFGNNPTDTVETPRGNFTGLYPPVFYAVAGLAASDDVSASVIAVRVFNGALFVGLVTAAFLLVPIRLRAPLLAGVVLPIIPLGMFIVPSTNPSSWAVLSAAVLWIAVLGFFETTGRRKAGLAVLATLATLIGAGARADAAIFAVIGLAGGTFLAARRDRLFLRDMVLPVALAILAVVLYMSASQSGAAATGLSDSPPDGLSAWLGLFAYNLINVPTLWVGVLGLGNLGWLDTPLPSAVWVGVLVVVVATVARGLRRGEPRKYLAVAGLVALLFLLPAYILTQSNAVVGAQVQPRYIMPLVVMLCGVALLHSPSPSRRSRGFLVVAAVVLALAESLALFINIRRYVTGLDTRSFDLDVGLEWWWPALPATPTAVWVLGSLTFALALALLVRAIWPESVSAESAALEEVADDVGAPPTSPAGVVTVPQITDHASESSPPRRG